MFPLLNGPLSNLTVTTGLSGDEPQIVLLDEEDNPIAFLDHDKARALANGLITALTAGPS